MRGRPPQIARVAPSSDDASSASDEFGDEHSEETPEMSCSDEVDAFDPSSTPSDEPTRSSYACHVMSQSSWRAGACTSCSFAPLPLPG